MATAKLYESNAAPARERHRSFLSMINARKGPVIGTVLTIPSVPVAQLAGASDCDFIMLDMEHAPMTIDIVTQMVHAFVAASQGSRFPIVRVPSHGVEWIKWALDSGAAGIIVPMVNNEREMHTIIDRAVYPPGGRRSFGPIYAPFAHPDGPESGMAGYLERVANGEIAILPMIESREGLENVEAIMSVKGVSGIFIGPADLRLSLGMSAAVDGTEPEFVNALQKICQTGKRLGRVVGCMGMGEEVARKRAEEGMDFLLSTFDSGAMANGFAAGLATARTGVERAVAKL